MEKITISKDRYNELLKAAGVEVMSVQEANKVIAEKLAKVNSLVKECEKIAEETGTSFSLDVGGYGMGGYFDSDGWNASSQSC